MGSDNGIPLQRLTGVAVIRVTDNRVYTVVLYYRNFRKSPKSGKKLRTYLILITLKFSPQESVCQTVPELKWIRGTEF